MPEPLRSISRTRWARWSGWLAVVALLCLGTAQVPLEDAPRVEALARELGHRIGADVGFGAVRVDPLGAGGVVVTDLRITGGAWRLAVPRAVWRPGVAGWLRADPRGVLRAESFVLELDGEVAGLVIPDLDVRLRGGRVDLAGAGPLLGDARITARGSRAERRFELEGVQPGGGRLDVRVRRSADGRMHADVFPEDFAVAGVPLASVRHALTAGWPHLEADGHWRMSVAPDGARDHEFDLRLRTPGGRQTDLQARGALATRPGDPGARFVPGSWLEVAGLAGHGLLGNGRLGRRLFGPATPELRVSGPVWARLLLDGPVAEPRRRLSLRLDDAHLRVAERLRKPTGVRARLELDHDPGAGPGRTWLDVELGGLRAHATRVGAGAFEGESGWLALEEARAWLPELAADVTGRIRLAALRYAGPDDYAARIDLEDARTTEAGVPATVSGALELGPGGFSATGLRAELAGTPLRLDLEGRRTEGEARYALVARVRLASLRVAPPEGDAASAPLGALVAAAEAPVLRLHEERARLAGVMLHSGRLEVGRLRVGSQVVQDLEIDLALRSLRLEVPRVAFRGEAGPERYSGSVDFNPLLPVVEFAEAP